MLLKRRDQPIEVDDEIPDTFYQLMVGEVLEGINTHLHQLLSLGFAFVAAHVSLTQTDTFKERDVQLFKHSLAQMPDSIIVVDFMQTSGIHAVGTRFRSHQDVS